MTRFLCMTVSLAAHVVAYHIHRTPPTTQHENTKTLSANVTLLSSIVIDDPRRESAAAMPIEPSSLSTAESVVPAIQYRAERGVTEPESNERSTDRDGVDQASFTTPTDGESSTVDRHDDFSRDDGDRAPVLRVVGLDAACIELLRNSRAGVLVVVNDQDGSFAFVEGPLDRPTAIVSWNDEGEPRPISERMLPIPPALQGPTLALARQQSFPGSVRLALTTSFDRYVLDRQKQAVADATLRWPAQETVGRFTREAEGRIRFAITRVR